jgi:hypothetical protein
LLQEICNIEACHDSRRRVCGPKWVTFITLGDGLSRLEAGGIFGVEDHRARLDRPRDRKAGDGYVREDYSIAELERAGFRRLRSSEASL